jgi:hypothetical protein
MDVEVLLTKVLNGGFVGNSNPEKLLDFLGHFLAY